MRLYITKISSQLVILRQIISISLTNLFHSLHQHFIQILVLWLLSSSLVLANTYVPASIILNTNVSDHEGHPMQGIKRVSIQLLSENTLQSWHETHLAVLFINGTGIIKLGAISPLSYADLQIPSPNLRIFIDDEEISIPLTTMPFSYVTGFADTIPDSFELKKFGISHRLSISSPTASISFQTTTNIADNLYIKNNLYSLDALPLKKATASYLLDTTASINASAVILSKQILARFADYAKLQTISSLPTHNFNFIYYDNDLFMSTPPLELLGKINLSRLDTVSFYNLTVSDNLTIYQSVYSQELASFAQSLIILENAYVSGNITVLDTIRGIVANVNSLSGIPAQAFLRSNAATALLAPFALNLATNTDLAINGTLLIDHKIIACPNTSNFSITNGTLQPILSPAAIGTLPVTHGGTNAIPSLDQAFLFYDPQTKSLSLAPISINDMYAKEALLTKDVFSTANALYETFISEVYGTLYCSAIPRIASVNWQNIINTYNISTLNHTHPITDFCLSGTMPLDNGGTNTTAYVNQMYITTSRDRFLSLSVSPNTYFTKSQLTTTGQAQINWQHLTHKPPLAQDGHHHLSTSIITDAIPIHAGGTGVSINNYLANHLLVYRDDLKIITSSSLVSENIPLTANQYTTADYHTIGQAIIDYHNLLDNPTPTRHYHHVSALNEGLIAIENGGTGTDNFSADAFSFFLITYQPNQLLLSNFNPYNSTYLASQQYLQAEVYPTQSMSSANLAPLHWQNIIGTPNIPLADHSHHVSSFVATHPLSIAKGGLNTNSLAQTSGFLYYSGSAIKTTAVTTSDYYTKTDLLSSDSSATIHWLRIAGIPAQFPPEHHIHHTSSFNRGLLIIQNGGTGTKSFAQTNTLLSFDGQKLISTSTSPTNYYTKNQLISKMALIASENSQSIPWLNVANTPNINGLHTHTTANFNVGAIAISHGGTGATTSLDARAMLGDLILLSGATITGPLYVTANNLFIKNDQFSATQNFLGLGTSQPQAIFHLLTETDHYLIASDNALLFNQPAPAQALFAAAHSSDPTLLIEDPSSSSASTPNIWFKKGLDHTLPDFQIIPHTALVFRAGYDSTNPSLFRAPALWLSSTGNVLKVGQINGQDTLTLGTQEGISLRLKKGAIYFSDGSALVGAYRGSSEGIVSTNIALIHAGVDYEPASESAIWLNIAGDEILSIFRISGATYVGLRNPDPQYALDAAVGTINALAYQGVANHLTISFPNIANPLDFSIYDHSTEKITTGSLTIQRGGLATANQYVSPNYLLYFDGTKIVSSLIITSNCYQKTDLSEEFDSGQVHWQRIIGKPENMPVSSHNHTADDFTSAVLPFTHGGLDSADPSIFIAAQNFLPRTGGTMNGTLTISTENGLTVGEFQLVLCTTNIAINKYLPSTTLDVEGIVVANSIRATIDATKILTGQLDLDLFDALADLGGDPNTTNLTYLVQNGAWQMPAEPAQPTSEDVRSYIFDTDNQGTLSSGTLNLSGLTYTGTMNASFISGNVFGAVNASNVTSLNADELTSGLIPTTSFDTNLQDLADDGEVAGSKIGPGLNANHITSGTLNKLYFDALTNLGGAISAPPEPTTNGLILWLEATDNMIIKDIENRVEKWIDKSGQNNHALQDFNAYKPIYKRSSFKNRGSVFFNGYSHYFSISKGLNAISVFAVLKLNDAKATNRSFMGIKSYTYNPLDGYYFKANNQNKKICAHFSYDQDPASVSADYYPFLFFTYTAICSTANHTAELYVNGALADSDTFAGSPFSLDGPTVVGAAYLNNYLSDFFKGYVAELIVYNRTLTPSERKKVDAYLGYKWFRDSTYLTRSGAWKYPPNAAISEATIESFIFNDAPTPNKTLVCHLDLAHNEYRGHITGSYVVGGTFGEIDGHALTSLNASEVVQSGEGTLVPARFNDPIFDLAYDGQLLLARVASSSFFITSSGNAQEIWTSDGFGQGYWGDPSITVQDADYVTNNEYPLPGNDIYISSNYIINVKNTLEHVRALQFGANQYSFAFNHPQNTARLYSLDHLNESLYLSAADHIYLLPTNKLGIGQIPNTYNVEISGNVKATEIYYKPSVSTFKVGGALNTFYPVVFIDNNWLNGSSVLEISRSNKDLDSKSRGSHNAIFTFHAPYNIPGAGFVNLNNHANIRSFITDYTIHPKANYLIVWLRGGNTSYHYRSETGVTLFDNAAQAKNLAVQGESFYYNLQDSIGIHWDDMYYSHNLSINGPTIIGSLGTNLKNPQYPTASPEIINNNLILWLDAQNPNPENEPPADGAKLATWKNLASEHHALQNNSNYQPVYKYGISQLNHQPAFYFGSNQFFSSELDITYTNHPNVTIITLFVAKSTSWQNGALWGNDNTGWDRFFAVKGGISTGSNWESIPDNNQINTPIILTCIYKHGQDNGSQVFMNGELKKAFTEQHFNEQGSFLAIGGLQSNPNAQNYRFYGYIAEVIIYNRAISDIEREKLENYLYNKWIAQEPQKYSVLAGSDKGLVLSGDAGEVTPQIKGQGFTTGLRLKTKTSQANTYALSASGSDPNQGLFVHNSGKVGFGTTQPSYTLEIIGDIMCEGGSIGKGSVFASPYNIPFLLQGAKIFGNNQAKLIIGDDTIYASSSQGLHLTILDKETYNLTSQIFQTYNSDSHCNSLANALNTLTKDQVAMLSSCGAWSYNLNTNLKNAFKRLGLIKAATITSNTATYPYAAIVEPASASAFAHKAHEVLRPNNNNYPFASIRGWFIEGAFFAQGDPQSYLANLQHSPILFANDEANIGIGTTQPQTKLHLHASSDHSGLHINAKTSPLLTLSSNGSSNVRIQTESDATSSLIANGLICWIDANDVSTVAKNSNNGISAITDKSGHNNNFNKYWYAPKHILHDNYWVIRFTGNYADGMRSSFQVTKPYTIFMVSRYWRDNYKRRQLQASQISWFIGGYASKHGFYGNTRWVSAFNANNAPPPVTGKFSIYTASAETGSSAFYINRVDRTTDSGDTPNPGQIAFGRGGRISSDDSDSEIAEIIIYNRVLSENERATIEEMLINKWNIDTSENQSEDLPVPIEKGMVFQTNSVAFLPNNTLTAVLSSSGNFGINQLHPQAKLAINQVHSTSQLSTIGTTRIFSTNPQIDFIDANHNDWALLVNNNLLQFKYQPYHTTGLIFHPSNNIGIGLSNPQEKLHVAGHILANKFIDNDKISPPRLNDLVLWLDANDPYNNGTLPSSNTPIAQWSDKSQAANHFSQSTPTFQPVLIEKGLNGRPALDFDGIKSFLKTSKTNLTYNGRNMSIFLVCKFDNTFSPSNPYETVFGKYPTNFADTETWEFRRTTTNMSFTQPKLAAGQAFVHALSDNQAHIIEIVIQANGQFSYYLNNNLGNAQNNPITASLDDPGRLVLGAKHVGSTVSNYFNGKIAEVLVYNQSLTPTQREEAYKYLFDKWMVTIAPLPEEGLLLWLDAADPDSMEINANNRIIKWHDKKISSSKYASAYKAYPLYYNDNGKQVVRLQANTNEGMRINGLDINSFPYTIFVVNKYWGNTRRRTLHSVNGNWLMGFWNKQICAYANGWVYLNNYFAELNTWYICCIVGRNTKKYMQYYVNGVLLSQSNYTLKPRQLALTSGGAYGNETSDADIGEIIIYNKELSVEERKQVEEYLAAKWQDKSSSTAPADAIFDADPSNVSYINRIETSRIANLNDNAYFELANNSYASELHSLKYSDSNNPDYYFAPASKNALVIKGALGQADIVQYHNYIDNLSGKARLQNAYGHMYLNPDTGPSANICLAYNGTPKLRLFTNNTISDFVASTPYFQSDGNNLSLGSKDTFSMYFQADQTSASLNISIKGAVQADKLYDFTNYPLYPDQTKKGVTLGNIDGLVLWLDADDPDSLVLSGTTVIQWKDKSGNNYHINKWSNAAVLQSNSFNGKNSIYFGNSKGMRTDILRRDQIFNKNEGTVFFVLKENTNSKYCGILGWQLNEYNRPLFWVTYSNKAYFDFVSSKYDRIYDYVPSNFKGNWHILTYQNRTDNSARVYIDKNLFLNKTKAANFGNGSLATNLYIGCRFGDYPFTGNIAEVLIFRRGLSDSERQSVENYLESKWFSSTTAGNASGFPFAGDEELSLWLDATDPLSNSILPAPYTNLSAWKDKSPHKRILSQATTSKQPIYKHYALNGKPVLNFLTAQNLYSSSTLGVKTIFVCAKLASNPAGTLFDFRQNISGSDLSKTHAGAFWQPTFRLDGSEVSLAPASIFDDSWHIFCLESIASQFGSMSLMATCPSFGSTNFAGGQIAELIIFNRDLSLIEKQKVESYLKDKWLPIFADASATSNIQILNMTDHHQVNSKNQWQLIYFDDFESSSANWLDLNNSAGAEVIINGSKCLSGHNGSSNSLHKYYSILPTHSHIRIQATYHFINSWENELAFMRADYTTAGSYNHAPDYLNWKNTSWTFKATSSQTFSKKIDIVRAHTGSTLVVQFGSLLNETPSNESWAIDNVMIYIK